MRTMRIPAQSFITPVQAVLVAALAVAVALFQACNRGGGQTDAPSMNGNNTGYDGKIFVHLLEVGLCPDGQSIDAAISVEAGRTLLIRDNCTDILGGRQISVDLMLVNGRPVVAFEGKTFQPSDAEIRSLGHKPVIILQSSAGGDIFYVDRFAIARMSADGKQSLWAKKFPSAYSLTSARLLSDGTLLVGGIAGSPATPFIASITAGGQVAWAKSYIVTGQSEGAIDSLAADQTGLTLAGWLRPGSADQPRPFVAKLQVNGDPVWGRLFGSTSNPEGANAKAVVASSGDIFATLGPRLAKLSSAGDVTWVKRIGDENPQAVNRFIVEDILPSTNGGFLAAGRYHSYLDGEYRYASFLTRIGDNGDPLAKNVFAFDNTLSDQGIYSLAEAADGSIRVTGGWVHGSVTRMHLHGHAQFDPNLHYVSAFAYFSNPFTKGVLTLAPGGRSYIADDSAVFTFADGHRPLCPIWVGCTPKSSFLEFLVQVEVAPEDYPPAAMTLQPHILPPELLPLTDVQNALSIYSD